MKFCDLLNIHIDKYTEMEPSDAVKLAYQSAFGGSYLDYDSHVKEIYNDLSLCSTSDEEIITPIGGGYARFDICSSYKFGISPEILMKMSVNSADKYNENNSNKFHEYINEIGSFTSSGKFSFSSEDLEQYLSNNSINEKHVPNHSEIYKKVYSPNYCIIKQEYIPLLKFIININNELKINSNMVIAIEGRSGSGKTYSSNLIKNLFDAELVHSDDFFLPFEMRTPKRTRDIGFNIHYERFFDEVIKNIRNSDGFFHGVYDCHKNKIISTRYVHHSKIIIIEGTYSMHPYFGRYYDLSAFFTVQPKTQRKRILQRNGEDSAQTFFNKWIPLEEKYFKEYKIKENSNFIINT